MNKLFLGLFDCHSGTEEQIRSHFLSEVTTIAHMLPVVSAQRPGEWTVRICNLFESAGGTIAPRELSQHVPLKQWKLIRNMQQWPELLWGENSLPETMMSNNSSTKRSVFRREIQGPSVSFSAWKQQLSRRVIGSLSETAKNPFRLTHSKRPGIFDPGAAIHHSSALGCCCSSSCANSLKRKIYIPG